MVHRYLERQHTSGVKQVGWEVMKDNKAGPKQAGREGGSRRKKEGAG